MAGDAMYMDLENHAHPRAASRFAWGPLLLLLCTSWACTSAAATSAAEGGWWSVDYPLRGYFRPGHYMPVRVANPATRAGQLLRLVGYDGALDTRLETTGTRLDVVLPWLPLRRTARLQLVPQDRGAVDSGAPPLRPLEDDERLVAATPAVAADALFAQGLFPGQRVLSVVLDAADPLPGPGAAWDSLDAVLLDAAGFSRVDALKLAHVLACGVTVAVRDPVLGGAAPGDDWPWRRAGSYWVLRPAPTGPRGAQPAPPAAAAIYAPVAAWSPSWPAAVRRRALQLAIVCSIALLGLALWRPPFTAAWALALGLVAAAGIGYWAAWQVPVRQCGGGVTVLGELVQSDEWTYYQAAAAAATADVRWQGVTWPVFGGASIDPGAVELRAFATGEPEAFRVRFPPCRKLALLTRSVGPRAPAFEPGPQAASPLLELVSGQYLHAGGRVVGRLAGVPRLNVPYVMADKWLGLVIEPARR